MDWLDIQHKLKLHWETFFQKRTLDTTRVSRALAAEAIGQAASVDAVVRALSRSGSHNPLSELEQDMLALRLHWAWCYVLSHIEDNYPTSQTELEDDFESLLIERWRRGGVIHDTLLLGKLGLKAQIQWPDPGASK
jgi:hypothetical protein